MHISNPLQGKGSVLVHCKTETKGTVLDPEARAGAAIQLPFPLLSWETRVRLFGDTDPKIINPADFKEDCTCTEILVPWLAPYQVTTEHLILDPITYRADNLIRRIKENADPIILQKSISKYHDEIASRISGKGGLLSRHVWSIRIRNSARFVATSGSDIPDGYVGIPRKAAQKMKVREGGLVLVNRAPTLWQGSVLVMKARIIPGVASRMNPKCLRDTACDHDGDSYAVFKWPDGIPAPSKIGPEEPCLPIPLEQKWDHTLGPTDLFGKSEFLEAYSKVKSLPKDLDKYVRGMTIDEFVSESVEVTRDLARMKLHMGMVSGTMDKVCALISETLLPIALRAKEKLVQDLLDSKHGDNCLSGEDVADAFERGEPDDMQAIFIHAGMSTADAQALVDDLVSRGIPPISEVFRTNCPEMAVAKGSNHREDLLITVSKYVEALCVGKNG